MRALGYRIEAWIGTSLASRPFWSGIIYLAVLMSIAGWSRTAINQLDSVSATIVDVTVSGGYQDPQTFARAALDISRHGWVQPNNIWILDYWPPGLMLLEGYFARLFGESAPLVLFLQLCASALFALVLTHWFMFLAHRVRPTIAFLLPLGLFMFPVVRLFLLEPMGVTFGENFAVGFLLLHVLLMLRSIENSSLRLAGLSGVALAASAYFRSQFELFVLGMSTFAIVLWLMTFWPYLRKSIDAKIRRTSVRNVFVGVLVAHALMIPWRVYHLSSQGNPSWVYTSDLVFANSVKPDELLMDGGGYLIVGGGNLVCHLEPSTCGDAANAKSLFFRTFLRYPFDWISRKIVLAGRFWFNGNGYETATSTEPFTLGNLGNVILLCLFGLVLVLMCLRRFRADASWMVCMWSALSLLVAHGVIFTFTHFEARYFFFPKTLAYFWATTLAVLCFGPRMAVSRAL